MGLLGLPVRSHVSATAGIFNNAARYRIQHNPMHDPRLATNGVRVRDIFWRDVIALVSVRKVPRV